MKDNQIIAFVQAMFELYAAGHTPPEGVLVSYLKEFKEEQKKTAP